MRSSIRRLLPALSVSLILTSCAIRTPPLTSFDPPPQRSMIRAADGTPLATLFEENRVTVEPDAIPEVVRHAVVATEDARFWRHNGIDGMAIVRAAVANAQQGRTVQGGSTITQQLAKLLIGPGERTLTRKVRETALAIEIEKERTKEQILTMYLNRAYFGSRAYGIAAASETYFGKRLRNVNLREAALLAGLIRAPHLLNPFTNPRAAKERRTYVLQRMADEHMITEAQRRRATSAPLGITPQPRLRILRHPWFVRYVEEEILADPRFGSTPEERADRLYTGGFDVQTTLDVGMQRAAERAVAEVFDAPTDPDVALVAIDPHTGAVKAMVGGRRWTPGRFNIAYQGRRQPGSTFKPFVLAAALEEGKSTESYYASSPTTLSLGGGATWSVDNFDHVDHGTISLRRGMIGSVNGVYSRLVLDVGADAVVDVARRAGIRSHLDAYPSIALGALTYGVTPLEMASAFATFAAGGVYRAPHAVQVARDDTGSMVIDKRDDRGRRTIERSVATQVNDVLEDVVKYGTGRPAAIGRPMAGKTGTTENHADAWFVGYTPDLVCVVWVGYRNELRPMTNVRGISVVGSSFPATIYRMFMTRALEDVPPTPFEDAQPGGTPSPGSTYGVTAQPTYAPPTRAPEPATEQTTTFRDEPSSPPGHAKGRKKR